MKLNKTVKYSCLSMAASLLLFSCNAGNSNSNGKQGDADSTQVEDGFISMFDANSLSGWEGDTAIWSMANGVLTGEIKADAEPLKNNTFIIWGGGETGDFELKGQFKISKSGNSGINYRSERFTEVPFALKGYQADIDGNNNYTGQNYEERNRTTLAYRGQRTEVLKIEDGIQAESKGNAWSNVKIVDTVATAEELKAAVKDEDWNEIHIIADGNKLSHYINGVLISEVIDNDVVNGKAKGLLGMQVHVGPPMKVEYKDLKIKIKK